MNRSRQAVIFASLLVVATAATAGAKPTVTRSVHGQQNRPEAREGHDHHHEGPARPPTGLTGLDNAIAHVRANLAAHPNKGLQNALSHLRANQAKHTDKGDKAHKGDKAQGKPSR
jgi:hypothetical protein